MTDQDDVGKAREVGDVIFMPEILFVGIKPGYYVLLAAVEDHVTLGFVDILAEGIAPTGRTINIATDALGRFSATTHRLDISRFSFDGLPAHPTDQE